MQSYIFFSNSANIACILCAYACVRLLNLIRRVVGRGVVFLIILLDFALHSRFFAPEIIFQSSVALHSKYGQPPVLCGFGQSEEYYPERCVPCCTHGNE